MEIYDNYDKLFNDIDTLKPKVIAIDGYDGVGKTTLAKDIQRKGYVVVNLDKFLSKKNTGIYFKYLNFVKIKKFISLNQNKKLVIEGVMVFKVLERLGIKPEYSIYLTDSVWIYEWLEEYGGKYSNLTFKEITKIEERDVNKLDKLLNPSKHKTYTLTGFRRELYKYTFDYAPWSMCDYVSRVWI